MASLPAVFERPLLWRSSISAVCLLFVSLALGMAAQADEGAYFDSGVLLEDGVDNPGFAFQDNEVVLGDLDGDGDLDAVTRNRDAAARVHFNLGDGRFFLSPQILGEDDLGSELALEDLDGDDDLDLWLRGERTEDFQQTRTIWLNDGSGLFTGLFVPFFPNDIVALGDIDGDDDIDAVDGVGFYLNQETQGGAPGEFIARDGFIDVGLALDVELGDLDNDGDLDMLIGSFGINGATPGEEGTRVWVNQGGVQMGTEGEFVPGQQLSTDQVFAVGIADFNGDGLKDLVEGRNTFEFNRIWFNQGNMVFVDSGQTLGDQGQLIIAGSDFGIDDLDDDGDMDLLLTTSAPDTPEVVYLNDGTGILVDNGVRIGTADEQGRIGYDADSIALGDVDGDGDLDALFGINEREEETAGNPIWLNGPVGPPKKSRFALGFAFPDDMGRFTLFGLEGVSNAFRVLLDKPAVDPINTIYFARFGAETRKLGLDFAPGEIAKTSIFTDPPGDITETERFRLGEVQLIDGPVSPDEPASVDYAVFSQELIYPEGLPGGESTRAAGKGFGFSSCRCLLCLIIEAVFGPPIGKNATKMIAMKGTTLDLLGFEQDLADVRANVLEQSSQGRQYVSLFNDNIGDDLGLALFRDPLLLYDAAEAQRLWQPAVGALAAGQGDQAVITPSMQAIVQSMFDRAEAVGTAALRAAIARERSNLQLESFAGLTMDQLVDRIEAIDPIFSDGFDTTAD